MKQKQTIFFFKWSQLVKNGLSTTIWITKYPGLSEMSELLLTTPKVVLYTKKVMVRLKGHCVLQGPFAKSHVEFRQVLFSIELIKASGIGKLERCSHLSGQCQMSHLFTDLTDIGSAWFVCLATPAILTWAWTFGLLLILIPTARWAGENSEQSI